MEGWHTLCNCGKSAESACVDEDLFFRGATLPTLLLRFSSPSSSRFAPLLCIFEGSVDLFLSLCLGLNLSYFFVCEAL